MHSCKENEGVSLQRATDTNSAICLLTGLCVRHHSRWVDLKVNKTEKAPVLLVTNSSEER